MKATQTAGGETGDGHRIILANESPLVRDLLRRVIRRAPHLHVVGEVTDLERLPSMVERTGTQGAQWVVVSLSSEGEVPQVAETLLSHRPSVRILAVATDGGPTRMKWMEARNHVVEDLSRDELVEVLGANGPPGSWHDPEAALDSTPEVAARELRGRETGARPGSRRERSIRSQKKEVQHG